jgi:hypothetical protein
MAGTLGGGVAESAFCDAAVAVATKKAKSADDARGYMKDIVPDDAAFRSAFTGYGSMTTTRAKYLLARLERQHLSDAGQPTDAMPDWSSKSVSVEHIFARSSKRDAFESEEAFDRFALMRDQLQNLTLLERTLNGGLEDKPFADKVGTYAQSAFALTREVGDHSEWTFATAQSRAEALAALAARAWPR